METVVIVIHLMVIIALVALVLMQRSEGGALGIGGGGGNFMSTRGQGNVLTRSTGILAAAFFATSILLTILARVGERPSDVLDRVPVAPVTTPAAPAGDGTGGGQGILDELKGLSQPTPAAPPADAAAPVVPPADATAPAPAGDAAAPATPAAPATDAAPAAPAAPATPEVPTTQ